MSRVDDLYARFEDRFRGSREAILERLDNYAALLTLLEGRVDERRALDCGCGRGEWLEMLTARGWNARGIDLNQRMLDEARKHGASVTRADAIAHLASVPTGSLELVTAFHLVEHLPIESLLLMLTEIARVVAPEGLVILETPNAENLTVGTNQFYLDPTHRNPLPPELLQFYVADCGFEHASILRINGEKRPAVPGSLASAMRPLLFRALDYSVIGTHSQSPAYRSAIEGYVAKHGEKAPTELDRMDAFDRTHADRRDADRLREAETAQVLVGSIAGTKHELHEAIAAVHNAVQAIAPRFEAIEGRLQADAAEREGSTRSLEAARASRQADLLARLAKISARLDSLERTYEASGHAQEAHRRSVEQTNANVGLQLDGLRTAMRQGLTNARKTSDAREYRIVAALEASRRATLELAANRQTREAESATQADAARLEQAVQEAERRVAAIYEDTTSWRLTRPMRIVVGRVKRLREPKATAVAVPPPATPGGAGRGLLSNRFVWALGKRVVSVIPGLRMRLLRSLDDRNLLASPLVDGDAYPPAPVVAYARDADEPQTEDVRIALMPGERRRLYLRMSEAQAVQARGGH